MLAVFLQLVTSSQHQTMFISYVFILFLSWALAILAAPLQGTNVQAMDLSNLTSLDLLGSSDGSIQAFNASNRGGYDIRCDGAKYGFNPSLSDCEGARSYIVPDSEQLNFGERHTGLPESTFPLPYVIMGGTFGQVEDMSVRSLSNSPCVPDKAECFFQPTNIGDGATARASLTQIRSAASALLLKCAFSDPSQGGIVRNIGKT